jgi:hypothetical protein
MLHKFSFKQRQILLIGVVLGKLLDDDDKGAQEQTKICIFSLLLANDRHLLLAFFVLYLVILIDM